jgi:hypothetical protein
MSETVEIKWVHVDDGLPEIPKGKYAVSVLVTMFDNMDGPDGTWYVGNCIYAFTTDRKGKKNQWFKGSNKEADFQQLYYSPAIDTDWGPTGDPVIYWAYMPEIPKNPILEK